MNPTVKPINLYQIVHLARQRLKAKKTSPTLQVLLEQQILPILSSVLDSARVHPTKHTEILMSMEVELVKFRQNEAERRKKLRDTDDAAVEVTQNRLYVAAKTIFEEIRDALRQRQRVVIQGFGSFRFYHKVDGRRRFFDFKTREMVDVPCKPKVKFVQKFLFDLPDPEPSDNA